MNTSSGLRSSIRKLPPFTGFVIAGASPEPFLLRAVGPTLASFGVAGTLSAPVLELFDSGGNPIATNAAWNSAPVAGTSAVPVVLQTATSGAMAAAGAFPLVSGSKDCAMIVTLPPGSYSATVSGTGGKTGLILFELYCLAP